MGIKSAIKNWLSIRIRNLLELEKLPVRLLKSNTLEVGRDSFHNGNFEVRGTGKVIIGSFCAFGKDIKLITSNHVYDFPSMQYSFYKKYFGVKSPSEINSQSEFSIKIGNDVWVGDNVCILEGVTIGTGAIIGAGSVVTKDVYDYEIVGGVPAKFIKNRFSDSVKQELLESKWWDWDEKKIKENKTFFFKNYNSDE